MNLVCMIEKCPTKCWKWRFILQGKITKPNLNQTSFFWDKKRDERMRGPIITDKKPKPNQDEIDAILDKISQSGYDSLSKNEKDVLFKASE